MHILLRERNLDVVLVQGVVDGSKYLTVNRVTHQRLCPYIQFEVDTAVAQLRDTGKDVFRGVGAVQMEIVDGIFNQSLDLCNVGTIGHTEWNDLQYIAVVACQVLIVLREQLCILESDYLTC